MYFMIKEDKNFDKYIILEKITHYDTKIIVNYI